MNIIIPAEYPPSNHEVLWVTLGGDHAPASFSTKRPNLKSGVKMGSFPLAIECLSQQEALDVMLLAPLVAAANIDAGRTHLEVATSFVLEPKVQSALVDSSDFFAVVVGKPAVYRSRSEVDEAIQGFNHPNWRRCPSFVDAIFFMLSKGHMPYVAQLQELRGAIAPGPPSAALVSSIEYKAGAPKHWVLRAPVAMPCDIATDFSTLSVSGQNEPSPLRVYQHIRELSGIKRSLTRLCSSEEQAPKPSLGEWADKYLERHGYTLRATNTVAFEAQASGSRDSFCSNLAKKGLPVCEADFLYDLIHMK
ncbi:hypothetical protein JAAARDRAFT_51443 [Jaapia argillacea MUCL 33604]|uniref:Uncharacterized protein n=1 Tax=Jaapia argillacea MUCL 33604 TaxID=933084 RepID=A0A067PGA8_9AGAM|nr:hypothetical protein JAAARDRAFT_51443 [Jaapia argillacea MUCL 33604]